MAQREARMLSCATHTTDAVFGTVRTAARNKRKRFVLPERDRASTACEIRDLFLYRNHFPNNDAQPINQAEPFDILCPFEEDVFGHGGGLD